MKYTKGEWKSEGKKVLLSHPGWSDDRKVIASCNEWLEGESEANAHLIAAAPDLYEACWSASAALQGEDGYIINQIKDKLAKAIAKAEVNE